MVKKIGEVLFCVEMLMSVSPAEIKFKVVYNKKTHDVALPATATVSELKAHLQTLTTCPIVTQKLTFKGDVALGSLVCRQMQDLFRGLVCGPVLACSLASYVAQECSRALERLKMMPKR